MAQLIHKHFQAWVVQHLQVDSLVGWKKLFQKICEYFSTYHAPALLMQQYTMLQLLD